MCLNTPHSRSSSLALPSSHFRTPKDRSLPSRDTRKRISKASGNSNSKAARSSRGLRNSRPISLHTMLVRCSSGVYPLYVLMTRIAGKRPWTLLSEVHHALPGATQNEVSGEEAEALVKAGVRIVAEGSNMVRPSLCHHQHPFAYASCHNRVALRRPSKFSRLRGKPALVVSGTLPAVSLARLASLSNSKYPLHSSEASNCGGVAVSGLEMAQNSQRLAWSTQEVDQKLKQIMAECYQVCTPTSSVGLEG